MTVALTMIVKDAAETLPAAIDSVLDVIDSWLIIDTGSSDDTVALIHEKLDHLPGRLESRPWIGFSHNRTELMREAHLEADWLLLLDADMVIHHGGALPPLEAYSCQARVQGSLDYALPLLVRGDVPWCYRGIAHAYLATEDDREFSEAVLDGVEIEDHSHTSVEKLQRDLMLLSLEHARQPLDARTCFYLAQTYADLGMIDQAIVTYRTRAILNGWDEETYVARHRLGALLCEHVSFLEGARELLGAWESRPHRAESLRTLANVANNIADRLPYPSDRLFVRRDAYAPPPEPREIPPWPNLSPRPTHSPLLPLKAGDVTAIIVTRGNVDLAPILETLPYEEVIVWDNSAREHDYRAFGRYVAIPEASNPVIYWQDDDVIFAAHDELLAAYEPGRLVCNMDQNWVDGAGYEGIVGMQGAGSLCDSYLPLEIFRRYRAAYPYDDDFLTEVDFVFGVLCPFTRIDIGYEVRPFADDADRLYTQPGQTERKWAMIRRCQELLAQPA